MKHQVHFIHLKDEAKGRNGARSLWALCGEAHHTELVKTDRGQVTCKLCLLIDALESALTFVIMTALRDFSGLEESELLEAQRNTAKETEKQAAKIRRALKAAGRPQ